MATQEGHHLLAVAEVPLSDLEIQRPSGRPLVDQTGREERVLVVSEYILGAPLNDEGIPMLARNTKKMKHRGEVSLNLASVACVIFHHSTATIGGMVAVRGWLLQSEELTFRRRFFFSFLWDLSPLL